MDEGLHADGLYLSSFLDFYRDDVHSVLNYEFQFGSIVVLPVSQVNAIGSEGLCDIVFGYRSEKGVVGLSLVKKHLNWHLSFCSQKPYIGEVNLEVAVILVCSQRNITVADELAFEDST